MTTALATNGNTAVAQQGEAAVARLPGGRLAGALAKAQRAVRRVAHDAQMNAGSIKYPYTSSEAVIEAAKDPLADNGLCLLPLEETLDGHEESGQHRYELVCKFLLIHESGETFPLLRHWPVCVGPGRPLDKATAAASTLCLSYLLRDLLLMPRVDQADEIAGRDDRPATQERPKKKAARDDAPKDASELLARLKKKESDLVAAGRCRPGELTAHVSAAGVAAGLPAEIASWDAQGVARAAGLVREFLDRHPAPAARPAEVADPAAEVIGQPEQKAVGALLRATKATWEECRKVVNLPDGAAVGDLTHAQFRALKAHLEERLARKAS